RKIVKAVMDAGGNGTEAADVVVAPHPPAGTFSPQAGRRETTAMLTPPSPRLRGEGKGEGPSSVGASLPRLDGEPKVRGDDRFGADERPDDALSVAVVRSPYWHARFTFGDLDAFVKVHPGIAGVFTAADIPGRNRFGVIPPFADQPALADGTTLFRGEAVAAIAGERDAIDRTGV